MSSDTFDKNPKTRRPAPTVLQNSVFDLDIRASVDNPLYIHSGACAEQRFFGRRRLLSNIRPAPIHAFYSGSKTA
jgi:hypothetical protein